MIAMTGIFHIAQDITPSWWQQRLLMQIEVVCKSLEWLGMPASWEQTAAEYLQPFILCLNSQQ